MDCPARELFELAVEREIEILADARKRLEAGHATTSAEDFCTLVSAVSDARMDLDIAVGVLEQHTRRHGCANT